MGASTSCLTAAPLPGQPMCSLSYHWWPLSPAAGLFARDKAGECHIPPSKTLWDTRVYPWEGGSALFRQSFLKELEAEGFKEILRNSGTISNRCIAEQSCGRGVSNFWEVTTDPRAGCLTGEKNSVSHEELKNQRGSLTAHNFQDLYCNCDL